MIIDPQKLFFRVPPMYSRNKKIPSNLSGYFLISEANMADSNFSQTVVLVLEHNKEGAFGLIVNRRSNLCLKDIIERISAPHAKSKPVYVGGPVQQEYLFVLHSEMPEGHQHSTSIIKPLPEVYFEPSFANIEDYFDTDFLNSIPVDDQPKIQLFLGYSGWGAGQLEHEMKIDSWICHPASEKIIFHPQPENIWHDALRQKGGIYKVFANTNQKPDLN